MKYKVLLISLLVANLAFGNTTNILQNDTTITNPNYDKQLADKLGGDDLGMKIYYLVILKTGTNKTTDQTIISESFRGHMTNINRLVNEGKMIVAGPLGKNENSYRGIFILHNINSLEEANEILKSRYRRLDRCSYITSI